GLGAAIPSVVAVLAWLWLRAEVLGNLASVSDPVLAQFPVAASISTALAVIGSYDLQALVLPLWLHPTPSVQEIPPAVGSSDPRVVVGIVAVAALVAGVVVAWRRAPRIAFGLAFFGGALLPVTNLLVPIGALAATRFLYLPLTGIAVAIAAGCARLGGTRGRVVAWVLAGWFVVVPGVLCHFEVDVWADQRTLFTEATERYPGAPRGWYEVGVMERAAGGDGEASRRAELAFDRAMACDLYEIPGRPGVYHEDTVEVVYQAAMSRAGLAQQFLGASIRRERFELDAAIDQTEHALRRAFEATRLGLRIAAGGGGAKTDWTSLGTDVLFQRVSLRLQRLEVLRTVLGPEQRASALAGVSLIVKQMRDLQPSSLRTALAELQLRSARNQMRTGELGRALKSLYQRSLETSISEARDVVQTYVAYLIAQEHPDQAARAFLDAHFKGVITPNALELCRAGLAAVEAGDVTTRSLGARALREVIARPKGVAPALLAKARLAVSR
ncbi:MAG: hypothetical protein HRU14_11185, partial [Planctomycetes bacterium]|nr:hypothetical protein [Planctomycetota bacterium]